MVIRNLRFLRRATLIYDHCISARITNADMSQQSQEQLQNIYTYAKS